MFSVQVSDLDSAKFLTYSTNSFQRLTLESWFTNLEQTSLNRCQTDKQQTDRNRPITVEKRDTSIIIASDKLTNQIQRTRPSTDNHFSVDSEDYFRSGCGNASPSQCSVLFRTTPTRTITLYDLVSDSLK